MEKMSLLQTQVAIKYLKDTFEVLLSKKLNLLRVSAPLFVQKSSGLNDDLDGASKEISFEVDNNVIEIVHSLAKWKRYALKQYGFKVHTGLYTDMNAIRKDEVMDNIHSIYVDQWDWEKIIVLEERNKKTLFKTVKDIYSVIYALKKKCEQKYGFSYDLGKNIKIISTKELEKLYPNNTNKEREYLICKQYKAVFIYQIGWPLSDGFPFDNRASDYDDWNMNGDILLFDEVIDAPLEISSMGIRVDANSLIKQVHYKNEVSKLNNDYCKSIIKEELPFTIGGGIGQSRLCMYFLKKKHIGEVQATYWNKQYKQQLIDEGLDIL